MKPLRRQTGVHVKSVVHGALDYDMLQRTATVGGVPCLLSNREASVLDEAQFADWVKQACHLPGWNR